MPEAGPLSEDLAAFLVSGLSISVATRDADLAPTGLRAWAAVVDREREHVEVFFHAKNSDEVLANLEENGRIAVLFVHPSTSRACQLKGIFAGSRRAKPSERREVERQVDGFFADLEVIGIRRDVTGGWKYWPSVAVRFRVEETFDQTPGPGAGGRIA